MRKALFWIHLIAGVVAGLAIFVMCVTGVMLTYEHQILEWADRHDARITPPAGAQRMPLVDLIAKAGPGVQVLTVHADAQEPVEVSFGRGKMSYLNPYTAEVTGHPSEKAHNTMLAIRDWHRGFPGGAGVVTVSNAIWDAANLSLLVTVVTALVIWWPKKMSWRHFRPILWFKTRLSGKARDFNWHNAIGVWCLLPITFIGLSGVVLSYRWANESLWKWSGTPIPRAPAAGPAGQAKRVAPPLPDWSNLDQLMARAEARAPGWKDISVRLTPTGPLEFAMNWGTGPQLPKRATLALNRSTGGEISYEGFQELPTGRKWRAYARTGHSGEILGLAGQTIAGVATVGAGVLVYTGFALTLRRFLAWRRRRTSHQVTQPVDESVSASILS